MRDYIDIGPAPANETCAQTEERMRSISAGVKNAD